ncbi:MAG: nucleotidyltransferase [Elusimicrobia bacterium RIFOXYB2_FULL_49_7]|nr:MAG: nucleotidyltransferase [Elusimicrobia bacterium RIFOXYB2_FULL_49_7]
MAVDIRWKQRFSNFLKAFKTVEDAVALSQTRSLSLLEQQGLIQGFEFTHELAWNVLKDYLEEKGISGLIGSKDAARSAYQNGLVEQGEDWMKMIADRNLTSHTYDSDTAMSIADNIIHLYYPAFKALSEKFSGLAKQTESAG